MGRNYRKVQAIVTPRESEVPRGKRIEKGSLVIDEAFIEKGGAGDFPVWGEQACRCGSRVWGGEEQKADMKKGIGSVHAPFLRENGYQNLGEVSEFRAGDGVLCLGVRVFPGACFG